MTEVLTYKARAFILLSSAIPYPNPKQDKKINKWSFCAMISCLAC